MKLDAALAHFVTKVEACVHDQARRPSHTGLTAVLSPIEVNTVRLIHVRLGAGGTSPKEVNGKWVNG